MLKEFLEIFFPRRRYANPWILGAHQDGPEPERAKQHGGRGAAGREGGRGAHRGVPQPQPVPEGHPESSPDAHAGNPGAAGHRWREGGVCGAGTAAAAGGGAV